MDTDITPDELSAAYRSSGLHRERFGLARALETPSVYAALRSTALARRKQSTTNQPEEAHHANRFDK